MATIQVHHPSSVFPKKPPPSISFSPLNLHHRSELFISKPSPYAPFPSHPLQTSNSRLLSYTWLVITNSCHDGKEYGQDLLPCSKASGFWSHPFGCNCHGYQSWEDYLLLRIGWSKVQPYPCLQVSSIFSSHPSH